MSELDNLIKQYVDADFDNLVAIARKKVTVILNDLLEKGMEMEIALQTVISAFCVFVTADNAADVTEYEFFRQVLSMNVDTDTFLRYVRASSATESEEKLVHLIHKTKNADVKHAYQTLALTIIACNETVTEREYDLYKLLV